MAKTELKCNIDLKGLDDAIEKVSQLNSLLEEANRLIETLNAKNLSIEVKV